jgi:hypothetical protein
LFSSRDGGDSKPPTIEVSIFLQAWGTCPQTRTLSGFTASVEEELSSRPQYRGIDIRAAQGELGVEGDVPLTL